MNEQIRAYISEIAVGIEEKALAYVNEYIALSVKAVQNFELKTGKKVKKQSILLEPFQDQVKQLIRGENVEEPDPMAINIASQQIEKAIKVV